MHPIHRYGTITPTLRVHVFIYFSYFVRRTLNVSSCQIISTSHSYIHSFFFQLITSASSFFSATVVCANLSRSIAICLQFVSRVRTRESPLHIHIFTASSTWFHLHLPSFPQPSLVRTCQGASIFVRCLFLGSDDLHFTSIYSQLIPSATVTCAKLSSVSIILGYMCL